MVGTTNYTMPLHRPKQGRKSPQTEGLLDKRL